MHLHGLDYCMALIHISKWVSLGATIRFFRCNLEVIGSNCGNNLSPLVGVVEYI